MIKLNKKSLNLKKNIPRYFEFIIGTFAMAVAFNLFLEPNDLVFGGVSGLSIIVKKIFSLDPALFILISSIFLLVMSFIFLGKEKTIGSIAGSLLFPLFVKLTANISAFIVIDNNQPLLAAIFGGVLTGIGAGLNFKAGFTTGGTDILNQIVAKYLKISIGKAMLLTDGLIVASGVFVFGVTKLLYAAIVLYIISIITDKVLLGISDSKAFYIITSEEQKVRDFITKELNHGVTSLEATGGYSKEKREVLMCVIPTKEYFKLKEGIHLIDKEAFFVVTDSYETFGGE